MVHSMKNLRMGDFKLSIKVARFVFEEGEIRDPPPPSKPVKETIVNRSIPSNGGKQVWYENTGTFSFKEALTGERSSSIVPSKVLRLGDKPTIFNDLLGRTLLVRVGTVVVLKRFQRELLDMGLGEGVIRYLGGLQFLVTFKNTENAIMAKDELVGRSEEFVHVTIWDGQAVDFERVAWVKILGLPIQLSHDETVNEVAALFGKVVQKENKVSSGCDLSGGFVGIIVNSGILINGEVSVLWSDKMYSVWVMEVSCDKLSEFQNTELHDGSVMENSDDDNDSDEDMSDEDYASDNEAKDDGTPEITEGIISINDCYEPQGISNKKPDSSPLNVEGNKDGLETPMLTKVDTVGHGVVSNNNKRKKNKGSNYLGQVSGNYSSSNDRPKKDCRLEENDPFGLAPIILGLNVTTNRGAVDSLADSVDFNDLVGETEPVQDTRCPDHSTAQLEKNPVAENQGPVIAEQGHQEDKKVEAEVSSTSKLGSVVGVDFSNFQSLLRDSIVNEGQQSGIK